jgi:hypothetical protein
MVPDNVFSLGNRRQVFCRDDLGFSQKSCVECAYSGLAFPLMRAIIASNIVHFDIHILMRFFPCTRHTQRKLASQSYRAYRQAIAYGSQPPNEVRTFSCFQA